MIIRNLYISQHIQPEVIHYVAATNAEPLRFNLMDYDVPEGAEARVYVQRADGTAAYVTADLVTVTIDGIDEEQRDIDAVELTPTTGVFAVPGPGVIQVQVVQGDTVYVSFPVPVTIINNNADGSEAGNLTNVFDAYLDDLDEAIDKASPVQMRKNDGGDIEWKRENEDEWTVLLTAEETKGETGERGPQGVQGPKGETGPQGPQGDQGPTGPKGQQGPKGDTGERGPQGVQGPTGPTGPQGLRGETGPKGDKGDKGETGAKGNKGDKGDTGADGISPVVTTAEITGGHQITITDASGAHTFDVMDGADAEVPEIEVGGRNLLLDSEAERVSPASADNSAYVPNYIVTDYGKPSLSNTTQVLTVSAEYEVVNNTADGAYIYALCNGTSINGSKLVNYYGDTKSVVDYIDVNNQRGVYRRSFTLTDEQAANVSNKSIRLRLRYADNGAVLKIKNVKLEIGNRATDYTPAPEDFAAAIEGIPFIASTTTTAGVWTGNAPFDALQDGQSIKYWVSLTGVTGQQTTLELTLPGGATTGAIPCYFRGANILTNHVGANNCCMLTYRENVTIGDETITQGWWLDYAYYKDTTTDTYDRTLVSNFKPTATGKIIYARQLVFQMSDGTFKSITNSNSTNTSHTACTDKANGLGIINPQIVHFYNNATNVAVGKACGAYMYSAISALDFRYSSNCGSTLTAQKPVYLVFTFEDGKYYLDDENGWYAQEIPRTASEEDEKYVYMFIGFAHSTYQVSLAAAHPMYVCRGGVVYPWTGNKTEEWQFVLQDGTTVTKKVVIAP